MMKAPALGESGGFFVARLRNPSPNSSPRGPGKVRQSEAGNSFAPARNFPARSTHSRLPM